MKLVVRDGWEDCRTADVRAVLADAAKHLFRPLRQPIAETITVFPAPEANFVPATHQRVLPGRPIYIQLAVRNKHWAQFAYQFSHELCHVLSCYERLLGNPNAWFYEALCELASLFTLRRMAEAWASQAPYENWADYSLSLASYAEECLQKPERHLGAGMTLASWLATEEDNLREDSEQRDKNAIVAYELLPFFESEPTGWNAVRRLPTSSSSLKDYLNEWTSIVEQHDQGFVHRIIEHFSE